MQSLSLQEDTSRESVGIDKPAYIGIKFNHCQVSVQRDRQLVITRFHDGTEAHACPHDTPEYHDHAIEKTGLDDILLYCWQHDLFHVMHGEMQGRPSAVLWALAHGEPTDTLECQEEERMVQDLQRCMQMRDYQ